MQRLGRSLGKESHGHKGCARRLVFPALHWRCCPAFASKLALQSTRLSRSSVGSVSLKLGSALRRESGRSILFVLLRIRPLRHRAPTSVNAMRKTEVLAFSCGKVTAPVVNGPDY